MERKKKDKSYLFERDGKVCLYCGKSLEYRQASMDHYYPRSKGGPDDIFNLVLSCKKCNKYKKSALPPDWEEKMVELFKRGVMDEKILSAGIKIKRSQLKAIAEKVDRLQRMGKVSVFQSADRAFHIRNNKIIKINVVQR